MRGRGWKSRKASKEFMGRERQLELEGEGDRSDCETRREERVREREGDRIKGRERGGQETKRKQERSFGEERQPLNFPSTKYDKTGTNTKATNHPHR